MDKIYFNYSACLRIKDAPEYHEDIKRKTKLIATHSHRKGDIRNKKNNKKWENDIWILSSPLPSEYDLNQHLKWIWNTINPYVDYFLCLKEKEVNLDFFCGFRSNCDHSGFHLESNTYKMLELLKIPIEFSIIIT